MKALSIICASFILSLNSYAYLKTVAAASSGELINIEAYVSSSGSSCSYYLNGEMKGKTSKSRSYSYHLHSFKSAYGKQNIEVKCSWSGGSGSKSLLFNHVASGTDSLRMDGVNIDPKKDVSSATPGGVDIDPTRD